MGSPLQFWHVAVFLLLGASSVVVLMAFPLWYICKKAGFSPWLTLLNCIPFGTPVLLYLLAFAEWKRHPMFAHQPVEVEGQPEQSAQPMKAVSKPIPFPPNAR